MLEMQWYFWSDRRVNFSTANPCPHSHLHKNMANSTSDFVTASFAQIDQLQTCETLTRKLINCRRKKNGLRINITAVTESIPLLIDKNFSMFPEKKYVGFLAACVNTNKQKSYNRKT